MLTGDPPLWYECIAVACAMSDGRRIIQLAVLYEREYIIVIARQSFNYLSVQVGKSGKQAAWFLEMMEQRFYCCLDNFITWTSVSVGSCSCSLSSVLWIIIGNAVIT